MVRLYKKCNICFGYTVQWQNDLKADEHVKSKLLIQLIHTYL